MVITYWLNINFIEIGLIVIWTYLTAYFHVQSINILKYFQFINIVSIQIHITNKGISLTLKIKKHLLEKFCVE